MQIQLIASPRQLRARFVSGIFTLKVDNPNIELHGWQKCFLGQGAGDDRLDPVTVLAHSNM